MQSYLGDQDVTLTIPLIDAMGNPIDAQSVEYRVIDQDESVLVAKTAIGSFVAGSEDVTIVVPALINALGEKLRALRVVEVFVTGESGIIVLSREYVLELISTIAIGQNSFQTYAAATLGGYELPNLQAWGVASKIERTNALTAAYRNFGKLRLRYVNSDLDQGFDQKRLVLPSDMSYYDITTLSAEQYLTLPVEYRAALCRAQIIEADFILGGDEATNIRTSGVMSATVGESSQFFRTSKPYEGALCKRALKEISRYIASRTRTGRS